MLCTGEPSLMIHRKVNKIEINQIAYDFGSKCIIDIFIEYNTPKLNPATMKKYILVLFLTLCMLSYSFAQEDSSIPGGSEDLPKSTFHINPLGLLQFGPILMYEARIKSSNAYFAPWFRFGYLGVLTHLSWDADEVSPLNLGIGTMIKSYSTTDSGNAIYYGGGLEYAIGQANYDVDTSFETEEKFTGLGILGNVGHRWRYDSGNFINLGLLTGVIITIKDEERFVSDGSLYMEYDETLFIAMLEFSFGWSGK